MPEPRQPSEVGPAGYVQGDAVLHGFSTVPYVPTAAAYLLEHVASPCVSLLGVRLNAVSRLTDSGGTCR